MPRRHARPPVYFGANRRRLTGRERVLLWFLLFSALLLALLIPTLSYFRELTGAMALSDATDFITLAVNGLVEKRMADPELDYLYFVSLERNAEGGIVAIVTNMARVNTLSAELLDSLVRAADSGRLNLTIPLGDLLGSHVLLGRGPKIPVQVSMLTSSRAEFHNSLESAGINQTKHRLLLQLIVDVDVLLPWEILSTEIPCEVLVAETIIVGSVPDTYVNTGG